MGLARQLDKILSQMDQMQNALSETDPLASQTIADALEVAQRLSISASMRQGGHRIDRNQLGQATELQEQAMRDLQEVLDTLASTAPEQRPEEEGGGHGNAPSQADAGHGAGPEHKSASLIRKDPFGDSSVVRLGRVSVPVYRPNSVTYVVSEVGVAMRDSETAEVFNVAENASRLRDVILASMHKAAGTSAMQGPSIDTEKLTQTLVSDLKADFGEGVKPLVVVVDGDGESLFGVFLADHVVFEVGYDFSWCRHIGE